MIVCSLLFPHLVLFRVFLLSLLLLPEPGLLLLPLPCGLHRGKNNAPLTGYEPNFFDDYHFSETTEFFIQESSSDTRPSYLHDSEISDYTIGMALSSPLFIQEREEPADRRQAYHSLDEGLSSSQSLSVGHVRTVRPVNELYPFVQAFLADCGAEIQKHEFLADYDRRSIQKLNGVTESERGEINRALAGDEQLRRDQQLLHEQLVEQNRDLREAHEKSLSEMEELKRFQGSTFDTIFEKKIDRRSRYYP